MLAPIPSGCRCFRAPVRALGRQGAFELHPGRLVEKHEDGGSDPRAGQPLPHRAERDARGQGDGEPVDPATDGREGDRFDAQARGHRLFYYTPDRLALTDGRVTARCWPVEVRRVKGDHFTLGAETEIPIDDLIDIGVFAGTGRDQKALFLEKRRLTGGEATFEVVVDAVPTTAGIDPYNKLIDRQSNDNVVGVSR